MKTIDFKEFVRNDCHPRPVTNELKTYSIAGGFAIIGATCLFGLTIAVTENVLARIGSFEYAESIVKFMKVFMPITLFAALAILAFLNPLL